MQAVILAGGLGTRLRPVSQEIPKPMVRINGVPYLEHQLRRLAEQGIRSVALLTGYLGEQIRDYFGDGQRIGMEIAYSREEAPLGTGGALRLARNLLAERFLLIYGDSLLPMDYGSVLQRLAASTATGLVVVYDNRHGDTSVANNIALDADGFVTRYEKRIPADPALTHVEAGVLAFRREVVDLIPEGVVSLEQGVFPVLIANKALIGLETLERFYDIGTPERLQAIEHFLRA